MPKPVLQLLGTNGPGWGDAQFSWTPQGSSDPLLIGTLNNNSWYGTIGLCLQEGTSCYTLSVNDLDDSESWILSLESTVGVGETMLGIGGALNPDSDNDLTVCLPNNDWIETEASNCTSEWTYLYGELLVDLAIVNRCFTQARRRVCHRH